MITINCNIQFQQLINSTKRFKVHQGGTRSGKTYAICQYICYLLRSEEEGKTISIIRKTLPALKGSVQRDIITLLEQLGMYWQGVHNKAENTFKYKNHLLEFLSVDEPQKIRGRKRDIAFLNEANELTLEDFRQINMRTTDTVIIDFNPSDPVHWIYNEVIPRKDCQTWITTYKDNKFLGKELIYEIERMKGRDPDYWRVYGEGKRAVFSKRQIFTNWEFIPYSDFPDMEQSIIGLDFGFSIDPATGILILKKNDKIYLHELFYKTGMTNSDIASKINELKLQDKLIYYDSAEPKSGEELKRKGLISLPATKGTGSINAGISFLKEHQIFVSKNSKNIINEYSKYWWTELKDGTIINKPLDRFNHTMDAIRYGVYTHYRKAGNFFVV